MLLKIHSPCPMHCIILEGCWTLADSIRSESCALQCLQITCRAAIHNGVCLARLCFLLDGSIKQKWVLLLWGDAHKAQCKGCISLKAIKAPLCKQSCILLFLSPPLFLPLAGATWAPDRWGSCFHCNLYREGAAQEEKEEIQSLGSAVLIHWFHLPGGFYLFKCLHSVPAGPYMYSRTKGHSHFVWLPSQGLQSECRRPLTPADTKRDGQWWQVPHALFAVWFNWELLSLKLSIWLPAFS